MKAETIKETILKKGVKAIPKAIWVICASYALIIITTVVALMIAHIDADKHINRYFEIVLNNKESKQNCGVDMNKLIEQINHNTELAHQAHKVK